MAGKVQKDGVTRCIVAPGFTEADAAAACKAIEKSTRFIHAVLKDTRRGEHAARVEYALRNRLSHRLEVAEEMVAVVERIQAGERHLDIKSGFVLGPVGVEVVDAETIRIADGSGYVEMKVADGAAPATVLGNGLRRVTRVTSTSYSIERVGKCGPPKSSGSPNTNIETELNPRGGALDSVVGVHRMSRYSCRRDWRMSIWPANKGSESALDAWRCQRECAEFGQCGQDEIASNVRLLLWPLCSECERPLRCISIHSELDIPTLWECDTPAHMCGASGKPQVVANHNWGWIDD